MAELVREPSPDYEAWPLSGVEAAEAWGLRLEYTETGTFDPRTLNLRRRKYYGPRPDEELRRAMATLVLADDRSVTDLAKSLLANVELLITCRAVDYIWLASSDVSAAVAIEYETR